MPVKVTGGGGSTDATDLAPKAKAIGAHTEGHSTTASGIQAHAEGYNTTATGSYSHAEGVATTANGADSHAEGSNTSATADHAHAEGSSSSAQAASAHAEGSNTQATGVSSHSEGNTSVASGNNSHAEGFSTTASGQQSHAEGSSSTASGSNSHAGGSQAVASRFAQHARSGGALAVAGDAQSNSFVARRQTTNATATVLTFDGSGTITLTGASANVLTVPASRAHQFRVSVTAARTDAAGAGEVAGWVFHGVIGRGSTGDARLVGSVTGQSWGDAAAAAWDVTLSVDTSNGTNNYLKVTVTGEAAKTIRWVATIDTTEVGY